MQERKIDSEFDFSPFVKDDLLDLKGHHSVVKYVPQLLVFLDRHPEIKSLDMSLTNVMNNEIKLIATNTTLRTLILQYNFATIKATTALAKNTTLTSLDLTGNELGAEGTEPFSENTTLTTLNLAMNSIGDEGALPLLRNNALTALILESNGIGAETAKLFAESTRLKTLNLNNNNRIGTEGAIALASNTTFTTLAVGRCGIGDEGVLAFAANKTLTTLSLFLNPISMESIKAFVNNKVLLELHIHDCNLGNAIAEILTNTSLVSLDVRRNNISTSALEEIDAMLARNKVRRITELASVLTNPSFDQFIPLIDAYIGKEGTEIATCADIATLQKAKRDQASIAALVERTKAKITKDDIGPDTSNRVQNYRPVML